MALVVFGYHVSALVIIAASLQIVTVLCATESIWGPNSRTRQVTKYVLFGLIGAAVAVLLERFFVVPSEYTLAVSLVTGASSGVTGGFLGQWFQDLAEATHLYKPTLDSLVSLMVARAGVEREIRAASHAKQTLARRRREIQANVKQLETVANIKIGRAQREREIVQLMRDQKTLDRLTDRNRRKLKLYQERLGQLDTEINATSNRADNYQRAQTKLESILTARRLLFDYLVFALAALGIGAAFATAAGAPVVTAFSLAFIVFMVLRHFGIIIKAAAMIASTLNLDGRRFYGLSWKHFLVSFLPMLLLQLSVWLLPTASWTNAAFAFVLAVGGGLAGNFARPADNLVKNLTKDQLKWVELGCIIAGIVLSVFRGS